MGNEKGAGMGQKPVTPARMVQLDGLRAFAVGAVIFSHWVPREYHGGIAWGPLGVQLFFVLSGYLITGILLGARSDSSDSAARIGILRMFYIRRCLRIFPLYYAVVVLITLAGVYGARATFWFNVSYTSNIHFFLINDWPSNVGHFWSLAVEEQFYLVWPWVVLFVPRQHLVPLVSVLMGVSLIAKLGLANLFPGNSFVAMLPFGAWDALGGGALMALLGVRTRAWRWLAWGSLFVGLPVWLAFWVRPSLAAGPVAGQVRSFAMVLVCIWVVGRFAMMGPTAVGRLVRSPALVGIGVVSYGLYILHPLVPILWGAVAKGMGLAEIWLSGPPRLVACLALLLALANLSWFAYERPLNRLKDRFPYQPS